MYNYAGSIETSIHNTCIGKDCGNTEKHSYICIKQILVVDTGPLAHHDALIYWCNEPLLV